MVEAEAGPSGEKKWRGVLSLSSMRLPGMVRQQLASSYAAASDPRQGRHRLCRALRANCVKGSLRRACVPGWRQIWREVRSQAMSQAQRPLRESGEGGAQHTAVFFPLVGLPGRKSNCA